MEWEEAELYDWQWIKREHTQKKRKYKIKPQHIKIR